MTTNSPQVKDKNTVLGYFGSILDDADSQTRAAEGLSTISSYSDRNGDLRERCRVLATWLASATAGIAGLVLVGWVFGLTLLTSISSSFMSMKITTAVGFLCSAGSVLLLTRRRSRSNSGTEKALGIASVTLAVPAVLLGFGTLLGYSIGLAGDVTHPGWMAQSTAGCFVLLGVALVFANHRGRISERISEFSTFLVLCIAGVALIGYLYDKDSLYAVGPYSSMALHTALSFVLLGAALLCARSDRGFMATFSSDAPGAVMMRRLLPLTVGMLVIIGWIRLIGEHKGWFGPHFGLTFLIGLNLVGFGLILWSAAHSLNRTESALLESEARFRTMAEAVPSFLFETDAEGWNIWTSEGWCRFTGQTPEQVAGHGWSEALHPDDRAANLDRWLQCMQKGVPFESQQRLRRADGIYTWVIARALPVRDEQGMVRRWVGSVTDVDDIVRAQDALSEGKDRLEGLVTSAMDAIITIDADQRIILFNPAAERMFGCLAGEVLGSSLDRFIPGTLQAAHRAHVEQFGEDGTTARRMGALGNISGVRTNGEEFPIEASISQMVSGSKRLFTVILRDITDRIRAEKAMQQRSRQLELLALASQRLLLGGESEEDLLEPIFMDIARLIDMERFYHYQPSEEPRLLRLQMSGGTTETERTQFAALGFGELLCGRVAERRERIIVEDLQQSFYPGSDVLRETGVTSYAGFPLVANGILIGTIAFLSKHRTHICDGDVQMIQTICDQIATALERSKLQRELRESEERLRLAHQAAGVGAFDWNVQTGVNTWTPELEAIYGLAPGEFGKTQRDWEKRLYPDDRSMVLRGVEEAFETGAMTTREFRIILPDGTVRWIVGLWQLFKDEVGQPLRLTGVNLDITMRKQTDVQIRETQERLRLATQAAEIGIWEWNVKTNQIRWDAQMFKIYQAAPTVDGLVSYSTWSHTVVPDDLPEQERVLWQTVRTRSSSSRQFRIRRYADGEVRYIEAVETVRTDEHGETEWVIGTNIDVSETRHAQEALRRSEQRLQRVLETDAVGVLFFNRTGSVIQANDVFLGMTGYTREQIEHRELTWRRMTPPEWIEASEAQLERFAQTGRIGPYEKEYFMADGSRRWMLFAGRDLGDGTIAEYCVDIHDRKETEQALRDAQQRLQRWNIELELAVKEKTSELTRSQERLRALATELNLAEQRERKRVATELHDYLAQLLVVGKMSLDRIKQQTGAPLVEELTETLDEALHYTRTLVAQLSPPLFHELGLAYAFKWLAEQMEPRGLRLTVEVQDGFPSLPEDHATLLFQAARELLINTMKHAGTDQARLTMITTEETVRIEVADNGSGFDVAALDSASADGMRMKFGLFSIRERMIAIGGHFDLVSRPGEGTRATLIAPLYHATTVGIENTGLQTELSEMNPAQGAYDSPLHEVPFIRVLLVDDHAMVRQGMRSILDAYPDVQVVGEAAAGDEAVALVDQLRPSVVVMDINMPRMNGIEATAAIKARHSAVVVIGLSVQADALSRSEMLRAGASALMTKEAAVEELYQTIQKALTERTSC